LLALTASLRGPVLCSAFRRSCCMRRLAAPARRA